MLRQRLLQKSPKRMRRRKNPLRRAQRQHPARIHRLHPHRQFLRRRRNHPRQKETRIFVGHHDACIARQRLQQTMPFACPGFDIRKIRNARLRASRRVVRHPSITNRCIRSLAHSYPQRSASRITSGVPISRQCSIARSSAKLNDTRRAAIIQYKTYFPARTGAPLQSRIRIAGTLCKPNVLSPPDRSPDRPPKNIRGNRAKTYGTIPTTDARSTRILTFSLVGLLSVRVSHARWRIHDTQIV